MVYFWSGTTVSILHARLYICSGSIYCVFSLLVCPALPSELGTSPQFTAQPSDVTAVSGRSATINCRASGTPQPGIVWYKDDARVVLESRLTVNRTGALVISSVRAGDAGSYFCVANNTVGSVQSYSARLQIASKWMKPLQWMDPLTYWYLWHTILSVQVSMYLGWEHTIKAWAWRIKCSPDNNKHRHSTVGLQPHVTLYPVSTIFMLPSLHAVWTHQRTLGKKGMSMKWERIQGFCWA